MIKVKKDAKTMINIAIITKVVYLNGKSETKMSMVMGVWLMAGYGLGHEGRHQVMILSKTVDGKKHKGRVYYPGN